MKSSAKKIELASVDDLFSTEEGRQDAKLEKIQEIPLSELHPFRNHPFKVKDDEAMMETADSIKQYGVLVPAIARPDPEGGYELVAGHRRRRASELAEKETMPVIIRDLDDDAATIIMVDSNLQRESLLPSERAFAYKMKLDAMKRQAGRPSKENVSQVGTQKRSDQLLAEQVGQSRNQIQRYIRLTELIPELMDMVQNADGKLVALYARTPEELYDKELGALEQIDNDTFCRKSPTVADYCEKWLLMQSVHVRANTLIDYTSKVRRHIIKELGQMRMADVTLDDIQLALVPVSEKSASVYKSVVILYKSIFRAAKESKIIDNNPTIYLTAKGGGVPQKDKAALTDEQAARLLDAIQGLPPYVFVMLGLYAGLRREEILALKWDSVYLDVDCPYLTVRRAWHTENNRPVILDELKTKAAHRNIPLPVCLADCLKETKANSQSEYVVSNRDGDPLSYTQFKRLWQYIVTRTVKERFYYRYEDGKRVKHTVTPVLGEKAAHNGKVIYSLDFEVTPHQLRHTYITNLIHSSVDPKTVQYLAGHESSKITMDIYAKVKYNRPDELVRTMGGAFAQWDAAQA